MKFKIYFLIFVLGFISCKKAENDIVNNDYGILNENFFSNQFELIVDNCHITIFKDDEFGFCENQYYTFNKTNFESKKFNLSKSESKTLFTAAYKLMLHENLTFKTQTCNSGQKFILRLSNGNQSIEFHEYSAHSWSKISKETEIIYKILKNKVQLKE